MILSMTGFAVGSREIPSGTLTVELRTVNHRYLDIQVRLPDELRALEPALREALGSELRRGKVDCRMSINRSGTPQAGLHLDPAAIEQLFAVAREVRKQMPDSAPLTVHEVLRWPGILAEAALSPEAMAETALDLLSSALADLGSARAREGAKLSALLEARCAEIVTAVERVGSRLPMIQSAWFEKLAARLREAGLSPDEERLRQELAVFATRIDIDEEVTRLLAHVEEVRRILRKGGSAGKRLDFLMQELHREANTLGSKSVDMELSQVAVELKVLIEQMREQVQNIE